MAPWGRGRFEHCLDSSRHSIYVCWIDFSTVNIIHTHIHTHTHVCVYRSWLAWCLQRLKSSMICCLPAGDPGEPVVYSSVQIWRPENQGTDGRRSQWEVRKRLKTQLKHIEGPHFPLLHLCSVGPQWIGCCLSMLGRTVSFTQSDSNASLIWK